MNLVRHLACIATILLAALFISAQEASNVVPTLIDFKGTLSDGNNRPLTGVVGVTFLLYKEEQGGSPLWLETQNVHPDRTGHYIVQLGVTKPYGLPTDLFASGEARWLAVQVQGQSEQSRILLMSVPYALKASDAQTLGGLPASAFVLAAPPVSSSVGNGHSDAASTDIMTPATNVTGTGTVNFIPLWTSTSNLGNSALFQNGSGGTAKVGINTTSPSAALDVKGATTLEGLLTLPATGAATTTAGKASQAENLVVSAFNSGTAAAVNQTFQWKAEPTGNNTTNPSGTLNLLFGSGTNAPAETGLKLSSKGLLTFATGQTFPGAGTITGVTAGSGLTGGGTSGNVTLHIDTTKVPQLNAANTFTGNQTITGTLSVSSNATVHANLSAQQLTSTVATGTPPLAVSSTTQVANLNASLLGGLSSSAFATLGTNTFTGNQTITSNISFGSALNVTDSSNGNGIQGFANNPSGFAVYGGNSGTGSGVGGVTTGGGIGVYGSASGGGLAGFFSGDVQTTGKITSYNGNPTVANGIPSIVTQVALFSGGGGNNNYTNLVTPTNDGIYRVTAFMECSGSSSGSSIFEMNFSWTIPTGQLGFTQLFGGGCGSSFPNYGYTTFATHVKANSSLQYNYAGMDAPFQITILIERIL